MKQSKSPIVTAIRESIASEGKAIVLDPFNRDGQVIASCCGLESRMFSSEMVSPARQSGRSAWHRSQVKQCKRLLRSWPYSTPPSRPLDLLTLSRVGRRTRLSLVCSKP